MNNTKKWEFKKGIGERINVVIKILGMYTDIKLNGS